MTSSASEFSLAGAPDTPRASQRRSCSCESRARWSHRTHLLCRSHPTTVAHRSTKSVGDLAARPQGGVGDVLRALGGGVVLESLVVAGAARRARDEKAAWAGRVSVPLSGPRQSDARTAAADDAPSPSRRCATPGSPSTPVLGAAGGQVLGAFDGDPLQTGISARKPPPPRRSYAAGSRRSAWFGGRYGRWGS